MRGKSMAKKARGLGRGLNAIFGEDVDVRESSGIRNIRKTASGKGKTRVAEDEGDADVSRETLKLRISLIEPRKDQPRKNFDEEKLKELSESIRQHGVLQPIIVRKNGEMYEILVGERRWRAARLAGLKEIPAIIRDAREQEAAEIALIENIQRENLSSVEEARAFRALIDEYGLKQEELAQRVAKSRTAVANSLRLLQLDDEILELLESGELTAGHARALLMISGKRAQYKAAREIINSRLSVREAEKLAKNYNNQKNKVKKTAKEPDIYLQSAAEELTGLWQTRVQIKPRGKEKGRIEIEYYSADDLDEIIDRLRRS